MDMDITYSLPPGILQYIHIDAAYIVLSICVYIYVFYVLLCVLAMLFNEIHQYHISQTEPEVAYCIVAIGDMAAISKTTQACSGGLRQVSQGMKECPLPSGT